ncbi:glycosyltransferase family 2 protein [Defluviimonas salinarum]|uniref:Glycosyltransferase n=1 Tax=Defluviimonas salinarum TaxID=2992147 RepID=A0ABT3J1Z7_9RHOB|nr:glycosyltransferase family 2 protein [Defluviimonas salinarum]MCW3781709.1 glycosyltransferase [Defluviimonas salinarum]
MNGDLISVVIPAHNSGWSIRDTIRSVRAQRGCDYEVIVVNDGSTDDLEAIMAPILASDARFRMVTQENRGLAAARNRGLDEAKGRYVAFLDADDLWHPDFLASLKVALDDHPEAPFAYAYLLRVDTANRLIPAPPWRHEPRHDFEGLLTLNSVGCGSASLFRRAAVAEAGGFDPTLRVRGVQGAEDWKLVLRLAARQTPVLVPRFLVGYRLVEQGMSQREPRRQLNAVRAVMDDIRAEFPDTPRRCFADARTLLNGWLLTAFARNRDYRTIARLLVESYLLNPLWFRSRELRMVHRQKIVSLVRDRAGPRTDLRDLIQNGERPFAFLSEP